VCNLHRTQEDEEHRFLGLASKPRSIVFSIWPQNQWLQGSQFGPQNRQLQFGDLGLKITAMVSFLVPQNHVGYHLSVVPQNQWEDEDDVGHTSRSSGLLHLEASRARISQSDLKTSGGAAQMVHVASSRRLCGDESKDRRVDAMRCIRLFYPNFVIFIVFGPGCNLVFWLGL
jgi:hypothetical protein